jgi:DNA-3-methyladenine glycosylase II
MAEEHGAGIDVNGSKFHAFPGPAALKEISTFPGISPEKVERLHGIADAALEGWLDREHLRSLPIEEARDKLKTLRGVGPFFADGILHRGAGVVDDIPNDDLTPRAVQHAYNLVAVPSRAEILRIAERWRPFRMWTTVLLHVWLRREIGLPARESRKGSGAPKLKS